MHLLEEKSTLSQSHNLIVENLTNEIKELNDKLNEYRKNDNNINNNNIIEKSFEIKPNKITEENEQKNEIKYEENKNDKKNLGFFGRFVAPIFLTENDLEKIQK